MPRSPHARNHTSHDVFVSRVLAYGVLGIVGILIVLGVLAQFKQTERPDSLSHNTPVLQPLPTNSPAAHVSPVVWHAFQSHTSNLTFSYPPDFRTEEDPYGRVITISYDADSMNPTTGMMIRFTQTSDAFVENPDPKTWGADSIETYAAGVLTGYELVGISPLPTKNYRKIYLNVDGSVLIAEVFIGSSEHILAVSIYNQIAASIFDKLSLAPIPNISLREKDGCVISGCAQEVCSEPNVLPKLPTLCEEKPEALCYDRSICRRQKNGACGWDETTELLSCIVKKTRPSQTH